MGNKYQYIDPELLLMEAEYECRIMQNTVEFADWMYRKGFLDESLAEAAGGAWYAKWKLEETNVIKAMLAKFTMWANSQIQPNNQFIAANRVILMNLAQYPVKSTPLANNAPDLISAIQRLGTPLSTNLRGFDLSRIEDDKKANLTFKKALIPAYNPTQGNQASFGNFARDYFSGADNKSSLTVQQLGNYIQNGVQFCESFASRITSVSTDINGIINYISQDPNGATMSTNLRQDAAQLANIQNTNAMNQAAGQANTNPANNVIHASAQFEAFMEHYFGEDWNSVDEATMQTDKKTAVSGNKGVKLTTTPTNPAIASAKAKDQQTPNGAPVDPASLSLSKKKIAVSIVEEAVQGKLTALCQVYTGFMTLLRTHVSSYGGNQVPVTNTQPQQQPPQLTMQNGLQFGQ